MKRGEIYYADLGPTVGSEISKRCPVLIVSNEFGSLRGMLRELPAMFHVKHCLLVFFYV